MTRRSTIVAAGAALLWASCLRVAAAQVPSSAPTQGLAERYIDTARGISIDQAVAMGLEREPELQASRTDVDVARGMRRQAALRPNPMMSVMRQQQMGGADTITSTEVTWPLDVFRRARRIAAADRTVEATEYAVADRQRALAADIRTAYGELLVSVRRLEVSDELVAILRRTYDLLRARVTEGASPPLERNMADVELRRIEAQQLVQAAETDAALIELKRRLGVDPQTDLKVRETLETSVQRLADSQRITDVSAVLADRPDVREADARLRLADARIDAARAEGRFDVGLFGSYMRMDFSFPQLAFGRSGSLEPVQDVFHNLAFGATVTVPLGNRSETAVATARAERAGVEHLRRARGLVAESEIASAIARDERARQALSIYTSGARTLARENLDVVSETYVLGRVTLTEVLAEQRRYLDVEMAYIDALRMAFEARTALGRALGDVK